MIKECLQFFIEPAKNLKIHLKECRWRSRLQRRIPLTESQLFIMELARDLTWICQRSDILAHIWSGEDIWPPAMCCEFITETASILEMMENTDEALLTHTDVCVVNSDCRERVVCVSGEDSSDLSEQQRSIMDWTHSQRRRHPHGICPGESVLVVLGDVEVRWRRGYLPHLQSAMELLIWVVLMTQLDKELIPRLWLAHKQKRKTSSALQYIPHTVWDWICRSAVEVTLDPGTAHPALIVSDDRKRMHCNVESHTVLQGPRRFDGWMCALGAEGFSAGRHYWEVELGERDWRVGVATESAARQGFGPLHAGSGYFTLRLERGVRLSALTVPATTLPCSPLPRRLGVHLDYEQGQLSFYDVQRRAHIYTYCVRFRERVYPVFGTADIMRELVIRPAALRWPCLCEQPCLFS
ncbi:E3 ubiquitin-protein ligase TRIM58 isoform X2 [Brachyhypopomus gauderio]